VQEERYRVFMQRAAAISTARLARRIGQQLPVLIDRVAQGTAYGRTAGDAPEIDGVVRLPASAATRPGEFARVRITAADTYDLEGELA
jgi:ribosomal protein S12 methylthiotransferase